MIWIGVLPEIRCRRRCWLAVYVVLCQWRVNTKFARKPTRLPLRQREALSLSRCGTVPSIIQAFTKEGEAVWLTPVIHPLPQCQVDNRRLITTLRQRWSFEIDDRLEKTVEERPNHISFATLNSVDVWKRKCWEDYTLSKHGVFPERFTKIWPLWSYIILHYQPHFKEFGNTDQLLKHLILLDSMQLLKTWRAGWNATITMKFQA